MLSQVVFHGPTWKFPHSFGGCLGVLILIFFILTLSLFADTSESTSKPIKM